MLTRYFFLSIFIKILNVLKLHFQYVKIEIEYVASRQVIISQTVTDGTDGKTDVTFSIGIFIFDHGPF